MMARNTNMGLRINTNINAIGAGSLQLSFEVVVLVVHTSIKAIGVHHVLALVRSTGNADHATAFDLGDLANDRPHCPSCTRAVLYKLGQRTKRSVPSEIDKF